MDILILLMTLFWANDIIGNDEYTTPPGSKPTWYTIGGQRTKVER